MDIRVIQPGEGELAFGGPMALRIIEDGSHTRHRLGLVEATLEPGPGRGHPLPHIHREHEEVFIVTKGKVRFTSGTESFDAEAGTVVVVPIGVAHTFANPFDETAQFIGTMTPDLYIQYFRDIGQLPTNERGQPDPREIAQTMARYATDVVQPV